MQTKAAAGWAVNRGTWFFFCSDIFLPDIQKSAQNRRKQERHNERCAYLTVAAQAKGVDRFPVDRHCLWITLRRKNACGTCINCWFSQKLNRSRLKQNTKLSGRIFPYKKSHSSRSLVIRDISCVKCVPTKKIPHSWNQKIPDLFPSNGPLSAPLQKT